jgi:hypothetical protein
MADEPGVQGMELEELPLMETMRTANRSDDWQRHLIEDTEGVKRVLVETQRIAVLGIKIEESAAPAFFVPEYAQQVGFEIVPVPVYYPDVTEILGEKVYRTVAQIPGSIDMVNVFRRPQRIPEHVDDIIRKRPKSVWFQLGIRNDEAAEQFARAGIDVVQDRCLMVELQHIGK